MTQSAAIFTIGRLARPVLMKPLFLCLLVFAVLVLQPVTVWLWLEMSEVYHKQTKKISAALIIGYSAKTIVICFCAIIVILLARLIFPNWIFLTLFSSLVAATSVLCMLYVVLCGQTVGKSWLLALDTWHKKISLALVVAAAIGASHGISFILAHEIGIKLRIDREFSVLSHSATIWILLFLMVFVAAVIAALLNCCLIFLFLEIIRRRQDPEAAVKLESLASSQAGT